MKQEANPKASLSSLLVLHLTIVLQTLCNVLVEEGVCVSETVPE
jgi:hypothetical protein